MKHLAILLVGIACLGASLPEKGGTVYFSLPLDLMAYSGDFWGSMTPRAFQACAPFTIESRNADFSKVTIKDPAGFRFQLKGAEWAGRAHTSAESCAEDATKRPGARTERTHYRYSLVEPVAH